jgi:type II secretory pathway pseudopilin PulG
MYNPQNQLVTEREKISGFSYLELLISLSILITISAFTISAVHTRSRVDNFIEDAAQLIRMRRAEAVRLFAASGGTSIAIYDNSPPLAIEFDKANPEKASSLVTGGPDATKLACPPGYNLNSRGACLNQEEIESSTVKAYWDYKYLGNQLALNDWEIRKPDDVLPIPNSVETTKIEFLAQGRVSPVPEDSNNPGQDRFWSIYFHKHGQVQAIAVYKTGLVEVWKYNSSDKTWKGFQDRTEDKR